MKKEISLPENISVGSFYALCSKRGETYTVFLKKIRPAPLVLDAPSSINGLCRYQFVYSGSSIVGVVFITPTAYTVNKGHTLCVGQAVDEENFSPQQTLNPLGLLLMVSDGSSVVIVNTTANIPLVIKVDKK